jgi:hypothetical protein
MLVCAGRRTTVAITRGLVGLLAGAVVTACGGEMRQVGGAAFALSASEAGFAREYEAAEPAAAGGQGRCDYWTARTGDARNRHLVDLFNWAQAKTDQSCTAAARARTMAQIALERQQVAAERAAEKAAADAREKAEQEKAREALRLAREQEHQQLVSRCAEARDRRAQNMATRNALMAAEAEKEKAALAAKQEAIRLRAYQKTNCREEAVETTHREPCDDGSSYMRMCDVLDYTTTYYVCPASAPAPIRGRHESGFLPQRMTSGMMDPTRTVLPNQLRQRLLERSLTKVETVDPACADVDREAAVTAP